MNPPVEVGHQSGMPLHIRRAEKKNPLSHQRVDEELGGDEEDRTPDLRIANAALSQLSYVPTDPKL